MTSPNSIPLLLVSALPACAPHVAAPPPAPVLAAIDCAYRVVEQHGFLAEEGTDWFPWRVPERGALEFTVLRGEGPSRETVSVFITTNPATGAVKAQAWGNGSWSNGEAVIRTTNSAAEDVARRVQAQCSVPARAV